MVSEIARECMRHASDVPFALDIWDLRLTERGEEGRGASTKQRILQTQECVFLVLTHGCWSMGELRYLVPAKIWLSVVSLHSCLHPPSETACSRMAGFSLNSALDSGARIWVLRLNSSHRCAPDVSTNLLSNSGAHSYASLSSSLRLMLLSVFTLLSLISALCLPHAGEAEGRTKSDKH